jgi:hypothetical protein
MNTTIKRVAQGSFENAYTYLLITLLLVTFVMPFLADLLPLGWIDDYLLIIVMLAGLFSITQNRRHVVVGLILALPAIIARMVNAHADQLSVVAGTLVFASTILFFCYLLWHILNDVLRGRRLTGEKITGSIVAYLVIGLLWAMIYSYIEFVEPGSFTISDNIVAWLQEGSKGSPLQVFTYFSFVTLTTLGYGDITPVSEAARNFAWFEAMVGQLFLAIMIARLVAIQVAESSREDSSGDDPPTESP